MSAHEIEPLREKIGHPDQLYGTRLVRIIDGPGDGIRALEVWNAAGLRFDVLADRGFDIYRVEYRGLGLHWLGPQGIRSRFMYEPHGWGWLRSFHGGLLVTCGLEHVRGPIERDVPEFNFPPKPREHFGLHGRIANEAGTLVAHEVVLNGDSPVLRIKGEVRQAALYNENLRLERELEVPLFEPEIRIRDCVTNAGFHRIHHELLYHFNVGYPLVDVGAEILLDDQRLEATAPQPDFVEQVTEHDLPTDARGFAAATVRNEAAGLECELRYRKSELPYFMCWYMMGQGPYVIGLEPSTAALNEVRDPATMRYLAPGEQVAYELGFVVREVD